MTDDKIQNIITELQMTPVWWCAAFMRCHKKTSSAYDSAAHADDVMMIVYSVICYFVLGFSSP